MSLPTALRKFSLKEKVLIWLVDDLHLCKNQLPGLFVSGTLVENGLTQNLLRSSTQINSVQCKWEISYLIISTPYPHNFKTSLSCYSRWWTATAKGISLPFPPLRSIFSKFSNLTLCPPHLQVFLYYSSANFLKIPLHLFLPNYSAHC